MLLPFAAAAAALVSAALGVEMTAVVVTSGAGTSEDVLSSELAADELGRPKLVAMLSVSEVGDDDDEDDNDGRIDVTSVV